MIFIKVKNQFEWFHKWVDAPDTEKFLRNTHRHIFYVETKIQVEGDDRELEYFAVKKMITVLIDQFIVGSEETESCEMIAEYIVDRLEIKYPNSRIEVSVLEDNENGSEINNYERFN